MVWIVGSLALAIIGGLALVVYVNQRRFAQRVADEMRALMAAPPGKAPRASTPDLPPPVERYRAIAVGDRPPVHTLWLRHGGTFCTSATAKPAPIRGTQLFTADPPGFVWTGHIHMAPGVWVDARDMIVGREGSMRVLLDDTVKIADARGPMLDQGAALRLLAEMVWFPTALFDTRVVTWSPIDDSHARATLRLGNLEVSGVFEMGADGLPTRMTAERFDDQGNLQPWGGTYHDYRSVSGMLVPFEARVSWQLPTGPFTYAHWLIEAMEFDQGFPAGAPSTDAPSEGRAPMGAPSMLHET